jgi:hypothetical protein
MEAISMIAKVASLKFIVLCLVLSLGTHATDVSAQDKGKSDKSDKSDKGGRGGLDDIKIEAPSTVTSGGLRWRSGSRSVSSDDALYDPAFDRYVDLHMLGVAWQELDSSRMTDATLQFTEAERVLLRSHKLIPAEKLFVLSAHLASERGDTDSLNRLEKSAEKSGNKNVIDIVSSAKKLGAQSRDPGSQMMIPVSESSVDYLLTVHGLSNASLRARITGEQRYLPSTGDIKDFEDAFGHLSVAERRKLMLILGPTRSDKNEPVGKIDEQFLLTLNLLSGVSRGDPRFERNIGSGRKIEIDRTGGGIRFDNGVRVGIESFRDNGPKVEQRGNATIVDREPKKVGVGFRIDW